MDEVFFFDEGLQACSKEEVRIEEINIEPYPDGDRVRLKITVTPFVVRPNLSIIVTNSVGETVASTEVLEVMSPRNELTLHLRGERIEGDHTLRATLYFDESDEETGPVQIRESVFKLGLP